MAGPTRLKMMLLKKETTYGTDSTPTTANDGILLRNVTIVPVKTDMVDRMIDGAAMGHQQSIPVGSEVEINGEVEFAGSGTAGTAPKWGLIARLCGMAEVLTASVDARYNPISSGFESATAYYYFSGKKHLVLGIRGTLSVAMSEKQIPVLKYKLVGLYGGITDASFPTGLVLTGWTQPLAVNKVNTAPATFFGATLPMYEFTADLANALVHRNIPGLEDQLITDKAPVGKLTCDDPAVATIDLPSTMTNATVGSVAITHGTVAGNIVGVTSAFVQITGYQYVDKNGQNAADMNLKFTQSATGNDNLILISK